MPSPIWDVANTSRAMAAEPARPWTTRSIYAPWVRMCRDALDRTVQAALVGIVPQSADTGSAGAKAFFPITRCCDLRRKRVGVEPTIHPAKGRIAGFEDREDHRTPCASGAIIRGRSSAINLRRRSPSSFLGGGEGHSFNQLENTRVGANFVIRALPFGSDAAVGEQLPYEPTAQENRLDGVTDRRLA
jgi:hypothetical protein